MQSSKDLAAALERSLFDLLHRAYIQHKCITVAQHWRPGTPVTTGSNCSFHFLRLPEGSAFYGVGVYHDHRGPDDWSFKSAVGPYSLRLYRSEAHFREAIQVAAAHVWMNAHGKELTVIQDIGP